MKNSIRFFILGCIINGALLRAQEIPSLRSLALDKSAELLHKQLVLPQSNSIRKAILNKCQAYTGVLFKPCETNQAGTILPSTENTETIIERFEQKYFNQLKEYKSFDSHIWAVTPDGKKVFVVKRNAANHLDIQVYDVETGNLINTLKSYSNSIGRLEITPDNTKAILAIDKTLTVWDLITGKISNKLIGHTSTIHSLKLTSDNTKAVSVSDGTLIIWDLEAGKALHKLQSYFNGDSNIKLTPDNSKVISTTDNGTFQVWDLIKGELIHNFKIHQYSVTHFKITPDNSRVISVTNNEPVVWDLNTGKIIYRFKSLNHVMA